jgi:hypothetical protein
MGMRSLQLGPGQPWAKNLGQAVNTSQRGVREARLCEVSAHTVGGA